MKDELQQIDSWAFALLAKWQPVKQRQLMREIGNALRRSQQQRMAAQQNPDGTPFTPRKPRANRLREKGKRIQRRAMFAKLRTARWLKVENDSHQLSIGFTGPVARLAQVHQEGKVDQVAPGGPRYHYPARVLLGLTQEDKEMIRDKLLTHFLG